VDKDYRSVPGLGIYMWADGASFEFVMNQEMGDQFPFGMDPTLTNMDNVVRSNATFAAGLFKGNNTGNIQIV